jgi:hypothetical protein
LLVVSIIDLFVDIIQEAAGLLNGPSARKSTTKGLIETLDL